MREARSGRTKLAGGPWRRLRGAAGTGLALSCLLPTLALPAKADSLRVGVGGVYAPDYPGSNDYEPSPFPSFRWSTDHFTLRTSGFGLELDILPSLRDRREATDPRYSFGPVVRLNRGRSRAEDPVVDLLPDVDDTVEVGFFVEAARPVEWFFAEAPVLLGGTLLALQGTGGGHSGLLVEATAGIVQPLGDFRFGIGLSAAYASSGRMEADFAVTPAGAALSGLQAYDPTGGLRDVGLRAYLSRDLGEDWTATAFVSYSRLVGEAADSPIVRDRGSANQVAAGVTLTYRLF